MFYRLGYLWFSVNSSYILIMNFHLLIDNLQCTSLPNEFIPYYPPPIIVGMTTARIDQDKVVKR